MDAAPDRQEAGSQDELYRKAAAAYGPALGRLIHAYEAHPDHRRDLAQDIHVALWRSFAAFDGRCSLRTWTYRVAHNIAATHLLRQKRQRRSRLVGLDEIAEQPVPDDPEAAAGERRAMARLLTLVQGLTPADRQVVLLYLEGLDAAAIGEVAGLSPGAVSVKIHRLKALLAQRFHEGRPS
jgi:RNA polymerase sigma-70 factor (ECF subfamily)